MTDNLERLTKAELIEMLKQRRADSRPIDVKDTIYDRKRDFPEQEQDEKKRMQAEKTRKFRASMIDFTG